MAMARAQGNIWGPRGSGIQHAPVSMGMINTPAPVRPSTDDDLEALALLTLAGKGVDRVNMDYLSEFLIPGYGKEGWLFGAPGNLFNKPKPPKKEPKVGDQSSLATEPEVMASLSDMDKQRMYGMFNPSAETQGTKVSSAQGMQGIQGDVDTPEEVQIMTTMLDNTKDPLKRAAIKAELQQASIRMRRV